jgi:hypothetical protein
MPASLPLDLQTGGMLAMVVADFKSAASTERSLFSRERIEYD